MEDIEDQEDKDDQDDQEDKGDLDDQEDEEDQEEVTEVTKSEDLSVSPRQSMFQKKVEREKEEMKENTLLVGSVANRIEGRNKGTYNYIIGDYIYAKEQSWGGIFHRNDGSKVLVVSCSSAYKQCKGRAHIDPETLKVLKFLRLHSCTRDPYRRVQIQMESEMKSLAETTTDGLRDIYDRVCRKNPSMEARMEFSKCRLMMQRRRNYILRAEKL